MSDTQIVKKLAAEIRKTMRRGPMAMRLPGYPHAKYGPDANGFMVKLTTSPGMGRDTFTPGSVYALLDDEPAWGLGNFSRRLFKRAMKKAGQPHRTNHKRGRMRRKAAGKNEVRP
jgi:hypothetical protein